MAASLMVGTMVFAQDSSEAGPLTERGSIDVEGKPIPYVIHRLPLNAFPQLPSQIADQLEARGCTIPQTYEAHQPENVVRASLQAGGSEDWAVLCSAKGSVSLLVFFAGDPEQPIVLASAKESERLQPQPRGPMGFNWGIDRATPAEIHDAQQGLSPRPARPDHDALVDSVIEHRTIYRFYSKGRWTLLDMPIP